MEYFIIFLPLIGSIISGLFGKKISSRHAEILTSGLVTVSAILSIVVFFRVLTQGYENNIIISTWINSGLVNVNWAIKKRTRHFIQINRSLYWFSNC